MSGHSEPWIQTDPLPNRASPRAIDKRPSASGCGSYLISLVKARHACPFSAKVFDMSLGGATASLTRIRMARCPSFKTSMRCAILTPLKSSNAERRVSILFKLGLQQRARIVEPVAPGLVRIEFSFRTLVASKHPDGPDAIILSGFRLILQSDSTERMIFPDLSRPRVCDPGDCDLLH